MNKDVIIVGCGFIGRIKAKIWCALGLNVYVYDIDKEKEKELTLLNPRVNSFATYLKSDTPAIVDISTPNHRHGDALIWVSRHVPNPQTILIEKPICSTEQEKHLLQQTFAAMPRTSVYVNETYYWSEALNWLVQRLKKSGEKPKVITINLSKNRLEDILGGRFFDAELQAYGIEVPHAIAILQVLGVNVFESKIKQNVQYVYTLAHVDVNQGVNIELMSPEGTISHLNSFLGNYYVKNDTVTANALERTVVVNTGSNKYTIEFDPIKGVDRYMSRITIESTGESILIGDNHLVNHMQSVYSDTVGSKMAALLSPQNSFDIYDFLSTLMENAQVMKVNRLEESFVMGREKD